MSWVAVGVAGVSAAGSVAASQSNGGKKGSGASSASQGLSQEQAQLGVNIADRGEQQIAGTQGLRTNTAETLNSFLQSGVTPGFLDLPSTVQPLANLSLPGVESERNLLRQRLLGSGTRGGQLQQQLFQADLQGGLQRTGLMQQDALRQEQRDVDRSGIRRSLFGAAGDMGTGGLALGIQAMQSGMGGVGQAAGNVNSLGQQRIMENMALQQGLGNFAGQAGMSLANRYMPAYESGSLGAQKAGGTASTRRNYGGGAGLTSGSVNGMFGR